MGCDILIWLEKHYLTGLIRVCSKKLAYELIWQGDCSPLFTGFIMQEIHRAFTIPWHHVAINILYTTPIYLNWYVLPVIVFWLKSELLPLIRHCLAFSELQILRTVLRRLAVCEMFVERLISTKCRLLCFMI